MPSQEAAPKTSNETWTKEEFNEVVADFQKRAVEVMERDGHHVPMAFVFATLDPETGKPRKCILPMLAAEFSNDDHKDAFSFTIKTIAEATQAVGVIFISEIWMKTVEPPPGLNRHSKEEVRKFMENTQRPSESSDRKEAIFIGVEHTRFGCQAYYSPIERDADNKPVMLPWFSPSGGPMTGRFVHLLPPAS